MYQEKTILAKLASFAIFALVPLFAFITVLLIPFLTGLFLTFTNWDGTTKIFNAQFVMIGLQNYLDAFSDSKLWETLWLTVRYVICVMIFTNLIAFLLAVLVSSNLKAKDIFRSTFFVPNLIGGVLLGFIWQFIFSQLFVYFGFITNIDYLKFSWLV
ncbi:MAG: hypothetical protein RLZZ156_2542, partial [Deinococcota bacterium]